MKKLAALCIVCCACSSFSANTSGSGGDAGTDAAAPADATVGGDGSVPPPPPPVSSFCMNLPKGIPFCDDFDGPSFIAGWPDVQFHPTVTGLLTGEKVAGNTALRVKGPVVPGANDYLRSKELAVPAVSDSFDLAFKIQLTTATANVEILTIEAPTAAKTITIYLTGAELKIRMAMDSGGATLPSAAWTAVTLHVAHTVATLQIGGGSVDLTSDLVGFFGTTDLLLSAGVYFVQDPGDVDFALDDVILTTK